MTHSHVVKSWFVLHLEKVYSIPIVLGEQWRNINCIHIASDTASDIMHFKTKVLLKIVISTGRHNIPKFISDGITPKCVKQEKFSELRVETDKSASQLKNLTPFAQ